MKKALKYMTSTNSPSARVVDGKLVLSLPGALTPVVWQMDFGEVKASALEVQTDNGVFSLVLKTPKGGATDIASFEKRDQAVDALMAASRALEEAHGKIRAPSGSAEAQTINFAGSSGRKAGSPWSIVLAILFLIVLFGVWASLSMRPPGGMETASGTAATEAGQAESPTGVPLSADDFLRTR